MKKAIYYSKSKERRQFVKYILSLFKEHIKGKVLIKVNHVSHEPYPTTTHPEMLKEIISHLQDNGHEVLCADGHGVDLGEGSLTNTPLQDACSSAGIELLNLYSMPFKKYTSQRGVEIEMSELPFQVDTIISLPVLKSHHIFGITGALKMCVGYFSSLQRIDLHINQDPEKRWRMIAEANSILFNNEEAPNHIIITDAITTLVRANELRHNGLPVPLGYLIAGFNCMTEIDIAGFNFLKNVDVRFKDSDYNCIPFLPAAIEYGLGSNVFNLKEVVF